MYKVLKSTIIHRNPWSTFHQDDIELPSGTRSVYGYVTRNPGVSVLLHTPDHTLLLLNEYRHPAKKYEWTIPSGGIEPGEDAQQSAVREVQEETGINLTGIPLTYVTEYHNLSSLSSEKEILYFAQVPQITVQADGLDEEVFSEHRIVTLAEALAMIDSGEVSQPVTVMAILLLDRKLRSAK